MKKWEQQNRLKSHRLKVSQAKSALAPLMKKRPSSSALPLRERDTPRPDSTLCPLYRVLKALSMQQYARPLIDRGFGDDLVKLELLRPSQLDVLFEQLKLAPGHRTKFMALIDYIRSINHSAALPESQPSRRPPRSKPTSAQSRSRPSLCTTPSVRTVSMSPAVYDRKLFVAGVRGRLQRGSAKDDILIFDRVIKGKTVTENRPSRLLERLRGIRPHASSSELLCVKQIRELFQSLEGGILTSTIINIDIEELCRQYAARLHSIIRPSPLIQDAKITLGSHLSLQSRPQSSSGRQSDSSKTPSQYHQSSQSSSRRDSCMQYKAEMQVSRQKPQCSRGARGRPLQESLGYTPLPYKEPGNQSLIKESQVELKTARENQVLAQFLDQASDTQEITSLIRESCLLNAKMREAAASVLPQEQVQSEEQDSQLMESRDRGESEAEGEGNGQQQSSDLRTKFFHSFRCDQPVYQGMPETEQIYGFVKNVINSAKMEKESPVISMVYLERVCEASGGYLTNDNWRNLAFISLVLASKIWDDQSFENDTFSKAFSDYTTLEINRLERVFSQLIEYRFGVSPEDYSKMYFKLRELRTEGQKCYSLRSLGVETVLRLQRTGARAQLTKDKFMKALDKSF